MICSVSGASLADIETKRKAAKEAKAKLEKAYGDFDKDSISRLTEVSLTALHQLYTNDKNTLKNRSDSIEERVKELKQKRSVLMAAKKGNTDKAIKSILPLEQPKSDGEQDYFIPISLEVSSSSNVTSSEQHSLSVAASAGSSWGLFSSGGTGSHESASTKAEAQAANSDVKVSFECMRVDITRSWLRPELFYDEDLRAAPGAL